MVNIVGCVNVVLSGR